MPATHQPRTDTTTFEPATPTKPRRAAWRGRLALAGAVLAACLAGCAGLPSHVDRPPSTTVVAAPDTVAARLLHLLPEARSEVVLVSPYFVPGHVGLEQMRQLRERGVAVRVITNATGTGDEPAVSLGYEHHRAEIYADGESQRVDEPESSWWLRTRLRVMSLFVPEDQL